MNQYDLTQINPGYVHAIQKLLDQAKKVPPIFRPLKGYVPNEKQSADVYDRFYVRVDIDKCQTSSAMRHYFSHENTVLNIVQHILNWVNDTNLDKKVSSYPPKEEEVFELIMCAAISLLGRWCQPWNGATFGFTTASRLGIREALDVMKSVRGELSVADTSFENKEQFENTVLRVNFLLGVARAFNSYSFNNSDYIADSIKAKTKFDSSWWDTWHRGKEEFGAARVFAWGDEEDFAAYIVTKGKCGHPILDDPSLEVNYSLLIAFALTTVEPVCEGLLKFLQEPSKEDSEESNT